MKKRGERKAKSSPKRKAGRPKKPVKRRASKSLAKSVRKRPAVKAKKAPTVRKGRRGVVSAHDLITKEEQLVKKEVRFLLSPQEFHVVTFVSALIILAFLLNSMSIIFYAGLTIAVLAFAHFLKRHHRPHDVLAILGLFFLPLAITLMAFRDVFTLLLGAVYLLSLLSTVIIYYVHRKAHTPLKIMWQVTYSKIIAITLAVIVACILPFIFPDTFMSVFELIFIFMLPVSFVLFFASKFLYLYFFDRKHIRHDLARSLKHTMIYTLSFIVILMCVYALLAVNFYNSTAGRYNTRLDQALLDFSNAEDIIDDIPEDVKMLIVTKDLEVFGEEVRKTMSLEKSYADERTLSFADIVDDSYLDTLGSNSYKTVQFVIMQSEFLNLKEDIVSRHQELSAVVDEDGFFADGSLTLDGYVANIKTTVDEEFKPITLDSDFQDMLDIMNDQSASVSRFENQGLFYWFAIESGMTKIYGADSILGRQLASVLKHSKCMRALTRLVVKTIVFISHESASSSAVEQLYAHREADLQPMSSAIRYGIIAQSMASSQERSDNTMRLNFKVD
ncbi:hypothetical protein ACFL3V_03380 [Nanoarchaeota archaeon]